jgi:hypothetical protein
MKYLHSGIQRSGTNFLSKLIHLNFGISFINNMSGNVNGKDIPRYNPLHKHFRIQDDKSTIVMDEKYNNDLNFETFKDYKIHLGIDDLKVVIIRKNLDSWLTSIKKWAFKCNWVTLEEFDSVKESYIREYQEYYNKWESFQSENENDIVILNLDNIINNFDGEFTKLGKLFDLKEKVIYPTQVNLSGKRKIDIKSKKFKIEYE